MKKLTDADRRALDLLVERTTSTDKQFAVSAGAVDEKRITAVENVFKLLSQMPQEQVPVDLLAKTLKRLSTAARSGARQESQINLPIDPAGPHA